MNRRLATTLATIALLTAATPAVAADAGGSDVRTAVATARRSTEKYHDVAAAVADGYVRVSDCVSAPGLGAMGIHYLNPALAADPRIDAAKPELLLYAPSAGRLRLVGVEYFRADADQDLTTDGDRPNLAGVPFDGPMPGHDVAMPIHYDLHVWAWQANPAGTFSEFNPNVHC